MPCGSVRDDINITGESFRNGTPWPTEADEHSNPIPIAPELNSNPVPPTDSSFNSNPVTWNTPNPAHFGNSIS